MGAILEMRRIFLGLAAAAALAGCAATDRSEATDDIALPEGEARVVEVASRIGGLISGVGSNNGVSAPREVPGGFTAEAIAAEPGAYRIVQINALGLHEPARVLQDNGGEMTIGLQSGPTAAFDNGVLVATRGFGDDLITLESAGVVQALRSGGGTVVRRLESLDAQNQILTDRLACTISAAGSEEVDLGLRQVTLRRFEENCRSAALVFDNIYWLDGSGGIVASRQYVSPTVAYLRSSRL